MRNRTVARTLALAALVCAPAAHAQGSERVPDLGRQPYVSQALAPGARVRATVAPSPDRPTGSSRQVTGRLVRLGADSVLVAQDDRIVAVPRHGLLKLEMPDGSVSRGRAALRGAGVGAVVGFLGGVVLGYLSYDSCEGEFLCFSREEEAVMAGAVAGTLGLAIGGAVGAANGGERWRRVAIDADTRVGVIATPRGVGLALAF